MTKSAKPIALNINGKIISKNDLPAPDEKHWTARKKSILLAAVEGNLITIDEVLKRYSMSIEEFEQWKKGLRNHGSRGLMETYTQRVNPKRRKPSRKK